MPNGIPELVSSMHAGRHGEDLVEFLQSEGCNR